MPRRMVRVALSLATMLAFSGCKGVGLSAFDLEEAKPPAGLNALDTESPESKANQKWFDGYYGNTHGWGWDKSKDDNCSFYNSCPDSAAPSGGGGLGW